MQNVDTHPGSTAVLNPGTESGGALLLGTAPAIEGQVCPTLRAKQAVLEPFLKA